MSGSRRKERGRHGRKRALSEANRAREDLRLWIAGDLGIRVPDVRVCAGHSSPMDYLWHAYRGDFPALRPTEQTNWDCVVWANRGGGKTVLAAIATLLDGLFKPDCRTRIVAGSFDQAGRMYEYLKGFAEGCFPEEIAGKIGKDRCRFVSGSEVRVLPQSQRAVRGQHVQKLRCDEVELFEEEIFDAAKFCARSSGEVQGAMECLSTMHRPWGLMQKVISEAAEASIPIFKWCLWEVIEKCPPERSCSRCVLYEDCRQKARRADGYLRIDDCIAQMRRSSRAGFESEMLCLRPNLEGAVFRDFDPAVHVKEVTYQAGLPLYRAIDFGYVNPFVCLWIQVDGLGIVRVIDEYVESCRTVQQHAEEIKRRTPGRGGRAAGTFCDPAGKQRNDQTGYSPMDVLRASGIPVKARSGSIDGGLEKIRQMLRAGDGSSRLMISPKCAKLIAAMECYHYPAGARGQRAEQPVKDGLHDHLIDALRYFFVNMEKSGKVTERRF